MSLLPDEVAPTVAVHFNLCFLKNSHIKSLAETFFADLPMKLAGGVQDRRDMNISSGPGVAIREFPLPVGQADYLLYVDARAAGVVEARSQGEAPSGRRVAH